MKNLLALFIFCLLLSTSAFAQAPEKMTYQAVIRDANSSLITSSPIGMQISILQGSNTGPSVYVETHSANTNINGLVSLEIGNGTLISGDFALIDWSNGPYFILTETDPTGGTNFSISGTSELLSVPYALHANTADSLTGPLPETDPDFNSSVASQILVTDLANWDNKLDTEVDGSITNEIQVLSISNDTIYLSDGGFAVLPAGFDGDYSSLTGAPVNVSTFANDAGYTTTDTTLNEAEVDAFVANNGFLTTEVDGSITNEIQVLSIGNDTLFLSDGGFAVLPSTSVNHDNDSTNEIQVLSISNDTMFLSDGGFAVLPAGFDGQYSNLSGAPTNVSAFSNDAGYTTTDTTLNEAEVDAFVSNNGFLTSEVDGSITNEIQVLSITNDTMFLSDGGFAVLPATSVNHDNDSTNEIQVLSISNDTIFLSNGGFVELPAATGFDGQYSSLSGAPTNVSAFNNDAGYTTTDTTLNEAEVDAFVSNNGYLTSEVDGSVTNEIQVLSIGNDTIYLSDGGFVELPAATGFDGQYSSLSGAPTNVSAFNNDAGYTTTDTTLNEAEVDAFVSNNGYLTSEVDGSVTNEIQVLSISNDTIYLSDGGFVEIPAEVDGSTTNEIQAISISNDTIFLSNGGFAELPAATGFDGQYGSLTGAPTNVSAFSNDAGYTTTDTTLNEAEVDAFVSNNGYLTSEVDGSVTNEIQALSISNDTVYLSNGGFVKLPAGFDGDFTSLTNVPTGLADGDDDTQLSEAAVDGFVSNNGFLSSEVDGSVTNEIQALSISNDTIYLSNGGFVELPTAATGFDGHYSSLSGAPTNVSAFTNDAGYTTTDTTLNEAEVDAFVANNGYLTSEVDGSVTNEIQVLSISNDTLYLSDGGFAVLPSISVNHDNDSTNEIQVLSISNDTIHLSDGGFVKLPAASGALDELVDADSDTKIQVEESADDDIIRFDLAGTEHFRMNGGRLEVLNTGHSVFLGEEAGANDDLSNNQNIYIGDGAGTQGTVANKNVAVGYRSLETNDTGNGNSAFGFQALQSAVGSDHNTAIGDQTLAKTSTGSVNVAVGAQTLAENTTGHSNAVMGAFAAFENTTGSENVLMGYSVNSSNTTGSQNTIVGYEAGYGNATHSKSGSVFLGYQAGYNDTTDNKLYIENSNSSTPLIYGDFANDSVKIHGTLNVNNAFSFPTTDGSATQVLATDGAGNVSWTSSSIDQTLSISNDSLVISGGNQVDLSAYLDNTDAQALSISNDTIYLSDGGFVELPAATGFDGQYSSLSGAPTNVSAFSNDAGYTTTDTTLNEAEVDAFVSNNGYITSEVDGSVTNEIQALSISNDTLYLSDGGFVALPSTSAAGDSLTDADSDTKIHVEESTDEDIIRFDMAGTEFFRMDNGRLEVTNTGKSVFLGEDAGLHDDLSDNENTFIGYQAGEETTTGADNTVVGSGAFNGNTTGSDNVALGVGALLFNTTGSNNVSVGVNANFHNLGGNNNTIIGDRAGLGPSAHSKSGNVFIGYQAGRNEISDNKLFIENSSSSTPLIYGDFAADLVKIYGTLNVNDAFSFPTSDGSANQTLTTDGAGNVSWSGGPIQASLSDADNDTKIQVDEFADDDIIHFDMAGTEFFQMDDGRLEVLNTGNSVFMGNRAGLNDDLTVNNNVFVGYEAGMNNTTGSSNIAIGSFALDANTSGLQNTVVGRAAFGNSTTGSFNTGLGNNAGLNNTTGASNTAIGTESLQGNSTGNSNTSIGYFASLFTTGSDNTAVGSEANRFNTSGSQNTIIGDQAGRGTVNHSKSGNVFIGYRAGYNETTSNKLYIENSNSASPLIYGDFGTDLVRINGTLDINNAFVFPTTDGTNGQVLLTNGSGQVTWGTATDNDNQTLSISNDSIIISNGNQIDLSPYLDADNLGNHTATQNIHLNAQWLSNDGGNEGIRIDNDGNVGIGTSLPAEPLHVFSDSNLTTKFTTNNYVVGGYNEIEFNHGIAQNNSSVIRSITPGDNDVDLAFLTTDNNGSPVEQMRITGNGEVKMLGTLNVNDAFSFPSIDGTMDQVLATDGAGNLAWTNNGAQTLSISNDSMVISNGNQVDLSPYLDADNLGNHVATQNVQLNGHYLSNDGDSEGIFVDTAGFVGIGTNSPDERLQMVSPGNQTFNLKNENYFLTSYSQIEFTHGFAQHNSAIRSALGGNGSDDVIMSFSTSIGGGALKEAMRINGNQRVGIGGAIAPNATAIFELSGQNEYTFGPHYQVLTHDDPYPLYQEWNWSHDDVTMNFDAYNNSNTYTASSDSGSNFQIKKKDDLFQINFDSDVNPGSAVTWNTGLVMEKDGDVGIGTNAPGYKFQVGTNGDGTVARANSWTTFSDRRWKTDFALIPDALDKLNQINGYTYKWKDQSKDSTTQVGVIAQEIEAILPQIVETDEEGYKSVDYSKLTALLIEGVKDLNQQVDTLEAQVSELTQKNQAFEEQQVTVETLKASMETMQQQMQQLMNEQVTTQNK